MNVGQLIMVLSAFPPKTEVVLSAEPPISDLRAVEREVNGKVVIMLERNE